MKCESFVRLYKRISYLTEVFRRAQVHVLLLVDKGQHLVLGSDKVSLQRAAADNVNTNKFISGTKIIHMQVYRIYSIYM